jgi:nitroreductase
MQNNQSYWEVVKQRRSIRKFTRREVHDSVIQKAFEAAILAPNSSNTQTWNFYWIQSAEKKEKAIKYCLSQSAARTANHLVAIVADPSLWRRSQNRLIEYAEQVNAPKQVKDYYRKLIPFVYSWGFLNFYAPFKKTLFFITSLFRPIMRGPAGLSGLQEVAIKSAALAAENFVLAITAQGFSSCMMEGFDESRMKKLLHLNSSARIVMMIAIGEEAENARWGPQYRLPVEEVVKIV